MKEKRVVRRVAAKNNSMPETRVQIDIPSSAEFVRVVRLAVTGIASRLSFSYDEIEDIKLAVSEACNNAIQHASSDHDGNARVVVRCDSSPSMLVVTVSDHGPGIPRSALANARKPRDPADDAKRGGLGMLLMRALMDEAHYESSPKTGTHVRLVKYANRP